jgi:anti-sigma28 factor (negative regulator of flagellin synthesis)
MDLNLPVTEETALPSPLVEIDTRALSRILPAGLSSRQLRIFELRKAIEAGEYQVSSRDLADALLRCGRGAN